MLRNRYLDLLDTDGQALLAAAVGDLDTPVPPCPGWVVRDVVQHTAEVYEHKMACIALRGGRPDPWPPAWPGDRDPLEWFADAHGRLLQVLTSFPATSPSWTWWPPDQTVGFWVRRMAQETAVHRADAESARDDIRAVDAELAVDGIDEVLVRMLEGDWRDEVQPGSTGAVLVAAGDRSWQVAMSPERVDVGPPTGEVDARVTGGPSDLLLWLWGRLPEAVVSIDGDVGAVRRLRERLAIATQ